MSVKYPNYVNLTSSRKEQPNERTPSPPTRKKSLSPPQASSKSISSKITHYTSSSSLNAADSGPIFDDEPLQKVSNDDHYNVFSMESTHPEQSKFVHDTYPIEQNAQNVIIDSLDMSDDREEIDQNDDDNDLAKERYSKETMGYYSYFPPKNKIVVKRYAEFLEKTILSQKVSGRAIELEEIQDEDTSPSENTSKIPIDVEGFEPPQEEVIPIRRSARTHRAPERLCLNIEVGEHSLVDLNKPTNYKASMLDSKSDKWLDAMNSEMQSMKDNQVLCLRLLEVNGFSRKRMTWMAMMDNSKRVYIPMQERHDLNKTQGASKPEEVKRKQNVPYALALGSIMYAVRCTRPDVVRTILKMDNSKRVYIPMQERHDLNKTQGASKPEEVKRKQNVPYALALGSIMYAVRCTRPDVVRTILKYLRITKDMFLVYGGNPKAKLRVDCYYDAGFETDRDDTKS
nr:retrotransposon protein, putative, Ty1-copia subclass [Tanacetum cinerariifolium]